MSKIKTEKVKIEDEEFEIKELSTEEALSLVNLTDKQKITEKLLEMTVVKPKLEEVMEKPARIGMQLMQEITKINGLEQDFPTKPNV